MRVTVPLTPEQEALLAREKAESEKLESYCVVTLTVTLDGNRATTKQFRYKTLDVAQSNAPQNLDEVFAAAQLCELELQLGLKDKAVTTWLEQPAPSEKEQKRMLDDLREIALVDLDKHAPMREIPREPSEVIRFSPPVDDAKESSL